MKILNIKEKPIEKDVAILLVFMFVNLLIHFLTNAFEGYGIFRDEYYYLACSHHMALGYVDQPPLSIYLLTFSRLLLGDSLFALRFLPAVAGSLTVLFTGLIVKKLDGGRTALIIASLAVIAAPILLAMNNLYSMNVFDILFWSIAAYLFVRLIKEDNLKLWIPLGIVIGLGLLNKISMGFFAVGVFAAVILSKHRKHLSTRWPYLAAFIAGILFLPYVIWNLTHHMAHLEFIHNASTYKYAGMTRIDFILGQFLLSNPMALPLWLAGFYFYFIARQGKPFRPLGIIFAVVVIIHLINGHSKPEYLSPAYPILFAAGAIQLERLFQRKYLEWLKYAFPIIIVIGGMIGAPMAMPCLPVETYIEYAKAIGIGPQTSEGKELAELPQFYADMFGWENMAKTVSEVYMSLPPEERKKTVIYAHNYGEAGSIEYYSRKYALPPVVSPHNNYWYWGWDHFDKDYETIIIIGGRIEDHLVSLETVEKAGFIHCQYAMPYENNQTVFVGRGFKRSLKEIWSTDKHFI
jgi:hypothetical protein